MFFLNALEENIRRIVKNLERRSKIKNVEL